MKFRVNSEDALLIVDVQKDFCPGGNLPVPDGDRVVPILNEYIKTFRNVGAKLYATRDWHPINHSSFREQGGIWPPHCIQKSEGAEFHPDLKLPKEVKIISKATNPSEDAYSGFNGTKLKDELDIKGIKRVFVGGLATEYCVKNTVLDAIRLGFQTVLLVDATCGINLNDSKQSIEEIVKKGGETATLSDIINPE